VNYQNPYYIAQFKSDYSGSSNYSLGGLLIDTQFNDVKYGTPKQVFGIKTIVDSDNINATVYGVYSEVRGTSIKGQFAFYGIGDIKSTGIIEAEEHFSVNGIQVISNQTGPITNPSGGITIDTEARSSIDSILSSMRAHGLIET
jgi:hypothetical protein